MATLEAIARPQLGEGGLQAWTAFIRAHSRLIGELDQELRERHGYPLGDFDVLVQLAQGPRGGMRMCDLAAAILLSPSGLSRRVDRLERAGLVTRTRGERDARNVEASLTPAGKRLLRRLLATHLEGIRERFTDRFSDKELDRLGDLLSRLTDAS
jgi:DNA-binding MarR family transcriptional regulator